MHKATRKNFIVRVFPLLVLVLTVGLLLMHFQQVRQLKEAAFESLILKTQQQARVQLKRLFDPVTTTLAIVGRWIQSESPDPGDANALNSRFMPILTEIRQMSSALLADTDGREYMLMRTGDGWLTRHTDAQRPGERTRWTRWRGPGQPVEEWQESLDYDPRQRPWFRGAVDNAAQESAFWTPPYKFFTSRKPGITAATRWPVPGQEDKLLVVALDVLLNDISALTMGLTTGEGGKAFILTGDGRVVGVPDDPQFLTPATVDASVLTGAAEFPVAVVQDAYAGWLAGGRAGDAPFVFTSQGTVWWAGFWNYPLGEQSLWLAVAVPEAELVSRLGGTGYAIPATISGIGTLMFLASIVVIRRYWPRTREEGAARAFDAVAADSGSADTDLPGRVQALIRDGETERLEFKSSVRWNFKAGRKGKEMELAWLKTVVAYMNTAGGTILLGVDDAGKILGLGNDGFASDDKALRHVENLIAAHIGPAHFPWIRSRMVTVDEKKVLMIDCKPAPKPVFLKHDKGEDFYIRTGPASRALSPSEVLAYIDSRKTD